MSLFPKLPDNALFISRFDVFDPLSTWSKFTIDLDDMTWPSVEHYFQGMKFADEHLRQQISRAVNPGSAQSLARWRFWKVRRDWKKVRQLVMTRGIYVKCRTYPEVGAALLATGNRLIVETSQYDYYWGCGRDGRGHNTYGKVLMNVRQRLQQESAGQESTSAP